MKTLKKIFIHKNWTNQTQEEIDLEGKLIISLLISSSVLLMIIAGWLFFN